MLFICAGLTLFYIFFENSSISLTETIILLVLFVVYIVVVFVQ